MTKVVVYSSEPCPYCIQAKKLLDRKNIAFEEVRVDLNPEKRDEMVSLSGRQTVPQIFINDKPIGGFDDLWALEQSGELDSLL